MFSNWNQLPLEVKYIVLRHMTRNTRLALSACSSKDKELVSSIRFRTVECFRIYCGSDSWCAISTSEDNENRVGHMGCSIESLQKNVQDLLRKYHFIDRLEMHLEKTKIQLLKNKTAEKLKVKELEVLLQNSEDITNIVEQVEPFYLEKVHITLNEPNEAVFDTQQVMLAEEVHVDGCNSGIREDQLMKLNAMVVKIEHMQFPVNEYIKKCIRQADSNIARFMFTFDDETLIGKSLASFEYTEEELEALDDSDCVRIIDTPYPYLKLKVKFDHYESPVKMIGTIEFDSEKNASLHSMRGQPMFRVIRNLQIPYEWMFSNGIFRINMTRRHQPAWEFDYHSEDEAQEKLDDILANTDYIKYFEICTSNTSWTFQPRDKPLIVRKLEIGNITDIYQTIKSLFEVIEPGHLKELIVEADAVCPAFLSMPHVIDAELVKFYQTNSSRYQQLRMEARNFMNLVPPRMQDSFPDLYDQRQEIIPFTETHLNQYFKRCLLKLNEKNFDFLLTINDGSDDDFEEAKLFEGLHIISTRMDHATKVIIINSTFQKYVCEVRLFPGEVRASRLLRRWVK